MGELNRPLCIPPKARACRHDRERTGFHDGADRCAFAALLDALCAAQMLHDIVMIENPLIYL